MDRKMGKKQNIVGVKGTFDFVHCNRSAPCGAGLFAV